MRIHKSDLDQILACLSFGGIPVLVPSEEDGVSRFVVWREGVAVNMDGPNTVLPPKDMLFPQTEKMYRYSTDADKPGIQEIDASAPQIVFGIRPCDAASIERMDLAFIGGRYCEQFYARRRRKLTIVAVTCTHSEESCFCESMGLDPSKAPSADVLLVPVQDGWNVLAQSEKGLELVKRIEKYLAGQEGQPLPAAQCTLCPDMTGVPEKLAGMFNSGMWDEVYHSCLGCGTCTYVCPTCYCFDINAEDIGREGVAFRCWDSCMFSEYTREAGGANPRPSKKERVRNRYMHKLSYFKERYGVTLCVGCGRCIKKCPVGMDITRIIDRAKGEQ